MTFPRVARSLVLTALFVLPTLGLGGCAGKAIETGAAPFQTTQESGVYYPSMSLIGRYGMGHACPVVDENGNKRIITAAHVATVSGKDTSQFPLYYAYSQNAKKGYVSPATIPLSSRDLGFLQVDIGDAPQWNALAADPPEPGDIVRWQEYSYRSVDDALKLEIREAKVSRVIAGHIVLDGQPIQGASGGCVVNADNEVVGVISWGLPAGFNSYAGVAPVVVGDWKPF